jgi:hypothetical protein
MLDSNECLQLFKLPEVIIGVFISWEPIWHELPTYYNYQEH